MRKIIICLIIFLCASFTAFSTGLLLQAQQECKRVQRQIENQNAPWMAKTPPVLTLYAANGVEELGFVYKKWAGELELLEKADFNQRATSQESFFDSSLCVYKAVGDIDLPSSFITKHSSVKDQANHGSCWAFGTVASFESAKMVQEGNTFISDSIYPQDFQDDRYDFSEQFLSYHNIDWNVYRNWFYNSDIQLSESDPIIQDSAEDSGGNKLFATYNLIRYGIPLETDFPYRKFDYSEYIRWNPTNGQWEDHLERSIKTLTIPVDFDYQSYYISRDHYVNSVKEILMKFGALAVSIKVPQDLYSYHSGVYVPTQSNYTGGHCVTLVGWLDIQALKSLGWIPEDQESVVIDDPNGYESWEATEFWVIKNSWNTGWGWNGYYLQPIASEKVYNEWEIQSWMIERDLMTISYFELDHRTEEHFDFNNDHTVNSADYDRLVQHLETDENAVEYDATYDCSRPMDGKIDIEDLTSFLKYLSSQ